MNIEDDITKATNHIMWRMLLEEEKKADEERGGIVNYQAAVDEQNERVQSALRCDFLSTYQPRHAWVVYAHVCVVCCVCVCQIVDAEGKLVQIAAEEAQLKYATRPRRALPSL